MKKTSFLQSVLLTVVVLFTPTSWAEWSMNVGVTTNYLWRAFTQTSESPAVSGGVDYEHESGLYFGTWVSTVDFWDTVVDADGEIVDVSDPSIEVDLYVGYAGAAGSDDLFGYSITYFQYIYPYANLRGGNYGDLIFDFNVSDFIFGMSITTDAQQNKRTFNEVGDFYAYLGYSGNYEAGWSVTTTLGFHIFTSDDIERVEEENPDFYSYMDLSVTKSTDYGDLTFSLTKIFNISAHPTVAVGPMKTIKPVISWVFYF